MEQAISTQSVYAGPQGYVRLTALEAAGRRGLLLRYANPDPRKLHAVDYQGMVEMCEALERIEGLLAEASADVPAFLVMMGTCDALHAGADITQFAGDPDYDAIRAHLHRGAEFDTRLKALWPKLRSVAVLFGDRYGGSVEWPLFCEYAVADARTRVQFSEVQLGIVPGWSGVLNVLLKSGAQNALYMGATGNPVSASQMLDMGLAQRVVETAAPPQRNAVPAEQWDAVWTQYCADCEAKLLFAALELAVSTVGKESTGAGAHGYTLSTEAELAEEIARRTNPAPYAALRDEIALAYTRLDPADAEGPKTLAKRALVEVAKLGKPLAPGAVEAVRTFVAHWASLTRAELLARYGEAAHEEAELCCGLMPTEHRRRGVSAVLSKHPAERVAVFE
jgi:enoyl-CoA hydratase/carnithine racemase